MESKSPDLSLALGAGYSIIHFSMKHAFAISLAILTTSSALVAEEVNATAPKKPEDTL